MRIDTWTICNTGLSGWSMQFYYWTGVEAPQAWAVAKTKVESRTDNPPRCIYLIILDLNEIKRFLYLKFVFSAVFIQLFNPEKCTLPSCVFDSEAITSIFKLNSLFALVWGSWGTRLSLPRNLADQHCKILPQTAFECWSMPYLKVCQC